MNIRNFFSVWVLISTFCFSVQTSSAQTRQEDMLREYGTAESPITKLGIFERMILGDGYYRPNSERVLKQIEELAPSDADGKLLFEVEKIWANSFESQWRGSKSFAELYRQHPDKKLVLLLLANRELCRRNYRAAYLVFQTHFSDSDSPFVLDLYIRAALLAGYEEKAEELFAKLAGRPDFNILMERRPVYNAFLQLKICEPVINAFSAWYAKHPDEYHMGYILAEAYRLDGQYVKAADILLKLRVLGEKLCDEDNAEKSDGVEAVRYIVYPEPLLDFCDTWQLIRNFFQPRAIRQAEKGDYPQDCRTRVFFPTARKDIFRAVAIQMYMLCGTANTHDAAAIGKMLEKAGDVNLQAIVAVPENMEIYSREWITLSKKFPDCDGLAMYAADKCPNHLTQSEIESYYARFKKAYPVFAAKILLQWHCEHVGVNLPHLDDAVHVLVKEADGLNFKQAVTFMNFLTALITGSPWDCREQFSGIYAKLANQPSEEIDNIQTGIIAQGLMITRQYDGVLEFLENIFNATAAERNSIWRLSYSACLNVTEVYGFTPKVSGIIFAITRVYCQNMTGDEQKNFQAEFEGRRELSPGIRAYLARIIATKSKPDRMKEYYLKTAASPTSSAAELYDAAAYFDSCSMYEDALRSIRKAVHTAKAENNPKLQKLMCGALFKFTQHSPKNKPQDLKAAAIEIFELRNESDKGEITEIIDFCRYGGAVEEVAKLTKITTGRIPLSEPGPSNYDYSGKGVKFPVPSVETLLKSGKRKDALEALVAQFRSSYSGYFMLPYFDPFGSRGRKQFVETIRQVKLTDEFLKALRPGNAKVDQHDWVQYASALELLGRHDDAVEIWSQIMENFPYNRSARLALFFAGKFSSADSRKFYASLDIPGKEQCNRIFLMKLTQSVNLAEQIQTFEVLNDIVDVLYTHGFDRAISNNLPCVRDSSQFISLLASDAQEKWKKFDAPAKLKQEFLAKYEKLLVKMLDVPQCSSYAFAGIYKLNRNFPFVTDEELLSMAEKATVDAIKTHAVYHLDSQIQRPDDFLSFSAAYMAVKLSASESGRKKLRKFIDTFGAEDSENSVVMVLNFMAKAMQGNSTVFLNECCKFIKNRQAACEERRKYIQKSNPQSSYAALRYMFLRPEEAVPFVIMLAAMQEKPNVLNPLLLELADEKQDYIKNYLTDWYLLWVKLLYEGGHREASVNFAIDALERLKKLPVTEEEERRNRSIYMNFAGRLFGIHGFGEYILWNANFASHLPPSLRESLVHNRRGYLNSLSSSKDLIKNCVFMGTINDWVQVSPADAASFSQMLQTASIYTRTDLIKKLETLPETFGRQFNLAILENRPEDIWRLLCESEGKIQTLTQTQQEAFAASIPLSCWLKSEDANASVAEIRKKMTDVLGKYISRRTPEILKTFQRDGKILPECLAELSKLVVISIINNNGLSIPYIGEINDELGKIQQANDEKLFPLECSYDFNFLLDYIVSTKDLKTMNKWLNFAFSQKNVLGYWLAKNLYFRINDRLKAEYEAAKKGIDRQQWDQCANVLVDMIIHAKEFLGENALLFAPSLATAWRDTSYYPYYEAVNRILKERLTDDSEYSSFVRLYATLQVNKNGDKPEAQIQAFAMKIMNDDSHPVYWRILWGINFCSVTFFHERMYSPVAQKTIVMLLKDDLPYERLTDYQWNYLPDDTPQELLRKRLTRLEQEIACYPHKYTDHRIMLAELCYQTGQDEKGWEYLTKTLTIPPRRKGRPTEIVPAGIGFAQAYVALWRFPQLRKVLMREFIKRKGNIKGLDDNLYRRSLKESLEGMDKWLTCFDDPQWKLAARMVFERYLYRAMDDDEAARRKKAWLSEFNSVKFTDPAAEALCVNAILGSTKKENLPAGLLKKLFDSPQGMKLAANKNLSAAYFNYLNDLLNERRYDDFIRYMDVLKESGETDDDARVQPYTSALRKFFRDNTVAYLSGEKPMTAELFEKIMTRLVELGNRGKGNGNIHEILWWYAQATGRCKDLMEQSWPLAKNGKKYQLAMPMYIMSINLSIPFICMNSKDNPAETAERVGKFWADYIKDNQYEYQKLRKNNFEGLPGDIYNAMVLAYAKRLREIITSRPLDAVKEFQAYNDINLFLPDDKNLDFQWMKTLLPKEKRTDEFCRMIGRIIYISGDRQGGFDYTMAGLEQFPDYNPLGDELAEYYVSMARGDKNNPTWKAGEEFFINWMKREDKPAYRKMQGLMWRRRMYISQSAYDDDSWKINEEMLKLAPTVKDFNYDIWGSPDKVKQELLKRKERK